METDDSSTLSTVDEVAKLTMQNYKMFASTMEAYKAAFKPISENQFLMAQLKAIHEAYLKNGIAFSNMKYAETAATVASASAKITPQVSQIAQAIEKAGISSNAVYNAAKYNMSMAKYFGKSQTDIANILETAGVFNTNGIVAAIADLATNIPKNVENDLMSYSEDIIQSDPSVKETHEIHICADTKRVLKEIPEKYSLEITSDKIWKIILGLSTAYPTQPANTQHDLAVLILFLLPIASLLMLIEKK